VGRREVGWWHCGGAVEERCGRAAGWGEGEAEEGKLLKRAPLLGVLFPTFDFDNDERDRLLNANCESFRERKMTH
jgi:hypothetical protein